MKKAADAMKAYRALKNMKAQEKFTFLFIFMVRDDEAI